MSTSTKRVSLPLNELSNGQMKAVEVEKVDVKPLNVLISKIGGQFYAVSAKCTHYGAPLQKGSLSGEGCVTCPWHGAKFAVKTGDIEDAPGLDSLFSFPTKVEGDKVFVEVDVAKLKQNNRAPGYPSACRAAQSSSTDVLIVGGGAGGNQAAQALRENNYEGSITLVSSEPFLPIDRTKLSKALIDDPSKVQMRDKQFYADRGIEVKTGKSVQSVDFASSSAKLDDGSLIKYGKVILATGASPNRLPVDGGDLENIFVLRTIEHTSAINKAIATHTKGDKKPRLAVVGTSFIGLEVAVATQEKAEVHVVGMDKAPFQAQLGVEVGNGIRKFHESKGVKFYMEKKLSKFEPSSSNSKAVGAVVCEDGTRVEADIVVLGVGVKPRTEYLKDAKEVKMEKGAVLVDEYFKIEGVKEGNAYAIGDIASYIDGVTKQRSSVGHWNVASNQGRQVARNIVGHQSLFTKPGVFWSAQGKQLRYVGTSESTQWEDVHIDGKPEELDFTACYSKGNKVVAVASMSPGRDPVVAHASELLTLGAMPSFSDVKNGKNLLDVPLRRANL